MRDALAFALLIHNNKKSCQMRRLFFNTNCLRQWRRSALLSVTVTVPFCLHTITCCQRIKKIRTLGNVLDDKIVVIKKLDFFFHWSGKLGPNLQGSMEHETFFFVITSFLYQNKISCTKWFTVDNFVLP
jgi:hypothetical protein